MPHIFIQYQNNSAVPILTQTLPSVIQGEEPIVGELVAAFQQLPNSPLASAFIGDLTLQLPDSVTRSASALTEDCFAPTDSTGTTLRNGLALTKLLENGFGFDDLQPLIIKSKNDLKVDSTNTQGIDSLTVGNEMKSYSLMFASQVEIPMTAADVLEWLCGSNTNSATDLSDHQISSQEQINSANPILFPLAGREESLEHIASCFKTSYLNRCNKDRNSRPIPVCTGIPGLGKTRLMEECASTVLNMTLIPGKRISGIVSFGNDGNSFGQFDELLGIQCSFAWRVLHMFFKAHYSFEDWIREKSPKNRRQMSLKLALSVIEQHWSQKTKESILVFIGIDEYQRLGQDKLNSLLDNLCDVSCRTTDSKLSFFCMLAGTDLNMTRIARTSHPNTERTPIRFLTHMESIKAIGPYISKIHGRFVVSEAFSQNVFYLRGHCYTASR